MRASVVLTGALLVLAIATTVHAQNTCFTRAPGDWGNNPIITQEVLSLSGGSVTSCGITLTNAIPNVAGSTTEDLCENSGDAKANNTSTQQLSLIRQCTAATLNLAATGLGNVSSGLSTCGGAYAGIANTYNTCCVGTSSVCDSGASKATITASNCIELLDAFNNAFTFVSAPSELNVNFPSNSASCQVATGNGFVNPGRNLGPAK